MNIIRIGIDIAKHVFYLHGVDAQGNTALRKKLQRPDLLASNFCRALNEKHEQEISHLAVIQNERQKLEARVEAQTIIIEALKGHLPELAINSGKESEVK